MFSGFGQVIDFQEVLPIFWFFSCCSFKMFRNGIQYKFKEYSALSAVVTPMLETTNIHDFSRNQFFLDTEFFSNILTFVPANSCRRRSRRKVWFLFSILKAYFQLMQIIFFSEFFLQLQFPKQFLKTFFTFLICLHLLVIIVIHFCDANDAKLRFASENKILKVVKNSHSGCFLFSLV